MKFKGTIIITDPCYVVKDPIFPDDLIYPEYDDYFTFEDEENYPDYKEDLRKLITKNFLII